MSSEQIAPEIRRVLEQDLAIDSSDLNPDDRLIEDLGLDSVAFSIALVAIEDSIGIRLSEEELMACHTIGDLNRLISTGTGA